MFKRGSKYYAEEAQTGKQTSLHTSDKLEALRLLAAKNEAANGKSLALAVGHAYLNVIDPVLMTRTWAAVVKLMVQRGGESTQARTRRAFDLIRNKTIHETTSSDFLKVLENHRPSTNHHLKLLQGMAMNLGWLPGRMILPKQCWPKIAVKSKRAITWEEHQRIVSVEQDITNLNDDEKVESCPPRRFYILFQWRSDSE